MQVLDYRHNEPTSSPPHGSWLVDNQPTATSSVPNPSSSPPHHSLSLAPSNSLTGISSHSPHASSAPILTSSPSTLHPSSHASRTTSDIYSSHHPSVLRDSPVTLHSRLNIVNHHENINFHKAIPNNNGNAASNANTHLAYSKFGNLLNVSNVAIENDRDQSRVPLSRADSIQHACNRDVPSLPDMMTSLPASAQPVYPLNSHQHPDYHQLTRAGANKPYDQVDLYQPTHRSQSASQAYVHASHDKQQDHHTVQKSSGYHQDYSRNTSNVYDNNLSSPPYPGMAPLPTYKQRTYGVPKSNAEIGSYTEAVRLPVGSSIPSSKPSPNAEGLVQRPLQPWSESAQFTNIQQPTSLQIPEITVGGIPLQETYQLFQEKGMNQERAEFLQSYMELMSAYEEKFDFFYDLTERLGMELMLNSRVPLLRDTITAPVDDETAEDASQKLLVKRKFVEAMEALQGDQLPTKRRGNLPKECTEYLKKWLEEHYDHPYPTDEEKLEMSKHTKIGMSQISHWFINYRKRVWKPSLPEDHPARNGDNSRKQRKRQKTGNGRGN